MTNDFFQFITIIVLCIICLTLVIIILRIRTKRTSSENIHTLQKEILKRIPDLVWIKDPKGVYILCNYRFEEFFGAKEANIIGKTDYDFVNKELGDLFRANDLKAIEKGSPTINTEEVSFAKDGHKEVLETIKTPIFDSNNKLIGVLGISRNISDLITYQNNLNDSKRILKDVLNTIPVRVFWKDLDLNYLGANQICAEDAGKNSPEEMVGLDDFQMSWKDQAELYRKDDFNVMNSGIPKINYEEPQTDENGKKWWLNTSKVPLRNAEGNIYGILGTYEEITERKQNEIDLAKVNKNLTTAKQKLETINTELQKALEEAQKSKELEKLNKELNQSHIETQQLNEELKTTNEELYQKNNIINNKNLELKDVIQHLKNTQAQLFQAEKMASLGILTAGVAHEINNPLNYIMGGYIGIEKVFNGSTDINDDEIPFLLNSIKIGLERATSIVKGLNEFSRYNGSTNEKCNLSYIIENCLIMLSSDIKHRIEIDKSYCNEDIVIEGNSGELHQVFINILTNSIQSIKENGNINILTQLKNKVAHIEINDNGCGINADDLKHITDPFFTTKDPGKGTGLGLSITHSILTKLKGSISFKSEKNKGTTTTITLPIKQTLEHGR